MSDILKTPLNAWHKEHGAKMAPFAGWEMPIQYEGIIAEHHHTREKASLFDICHMGEFIISGPGAGDALSGVVTHNLATLKPGKCRYGFLTNENGGVRDDLIIYCMGEDYYMLVVNGACEASDFEWVSANMPAGVTAANVSAQAAKIDLQGPASMDVIENVLGMPFRQLGYFSFVEVDFVGTKLLVSRTGYTGELGFEFYLNADHALSLWEKFLFDERVKPAGLGARDTLRLEMGLPLYGQDLDTEHTPAEAGYEMMLKSEADYVGKGKDREIKEKLVALSIPGRRSARHDDIVLSESGEEIGRVTSASFAPSLGHSIALAYLKPDAAEAEKFVIKGARTELAAEKAELPFYKEGTARMKFD